MYTIICLIWVGFMLDAPTLYFILLGIAAYQKLREILI